MSNEMTILTRTFDLLAWLLPKGESFPKAYRHTVTQHREARLRHREEPEDVHLEHPAHRIDRDEFDRAPAGDTGIVDEARQATSANRAGDPGGRGADLGRVGDVQPDGNESRRGRLLEPRPVVRRADTRKDGVAKPVEPNRTGMADPSRRAGDENERRRHGRSHQNANMWVALTITLRPGTTSGCAGSLIRCSFRTM